MTKHKLGQNAEAIHTHTYSLYSVSAPPTPLCDRGGVEGRLELLAQTAQGAARTAALPSPRGRQPACRRRPQGRPAGGSAAGPGPPSPGRCCKLGEWEPVGGRRRGGQQCLTSSCNTTVILQYQSIQVSALDRMFFSCRLPRVVVGVVCRNQTAGRR